MIKKFIIHTQKEGLHDITSNVVNVVNESKITDGIVVVFSPHTSAAITITENSDPHVLTDLIFALNKISPELKEFNHNELNSHAHVKSSLIGASELLIIQHGQVILGTWQGIYFCEFDGPRTRTYYVKIIGN